MTPEQFRHQKLWWLAVFLYDHIRDLRQLTMRIAADEAAKEKPSMRVLSNLATTEEALRKCHVVVRDAVYRAVTVPVKKP